MAGLVGLFMRDGAPASADAVARMAAAAGYRASDGAWTWHDGPFAAARQRTICTSEDSLETGPVISADSRSLLMFDGRLDNRSELAERLGIDPPDLGAMPDASIALRAWLRWREKCPGSLLGDFMLVAWDREAREVFCASDPFGLRPLHYFLNDRVLAFATEIRQLLAHPLVPKRVDERFLGEVLAVEPGSNGRTLYQDVHRLPHAHVLSVAERSHRLWRDWKPAPPLLQLRNNDEYAEAFRVEFDRAVNAALRCPGPVGVQLSGGLDSSSVLATAKTIDPGRELLAFSLLFPKGTDADERAYIDAVLRHVPAQAVQIPAPAFNADEAKDQARARQYLPDYPHTLIASALRRAMASRGVRVSLTGSGSDLGLSGSYFHYADLLTEGRLIAFARRYRDMARSPERGWTNAEVLRGAVWPLLPTGVRGLLRPLARRMIGLTVPEWIEPSFATRIGLADRLPGISSPARGRLATATVAAAYDGGLVHLVHDLYELGESEAGIVDRHPFLDRRLVELIVSLPDEQRWSRGQMKFVLRRAMGTRLPALVRERSDHTKSDFSHLTVDALAGLGGRAFFRDLWIESCGWARPGALAELYDRMERLRKLGDLRSRDLGWELWSAAAVELWYSQVFEQSSSTRTSWNNSPMKQVPGPKIGREHANPTASRN